MYGGKPLHPRLVCAGQELLLCLQCSAAGVCKGSHACQAWRERAQLSHQNSPAAWEFCTADLLLTGNAVQVIYGTCEGFNNFVLPSVLNFTGDCWEGAKSRIGDAALASLQSFREQVSPQAADGHASPCLASMQTAPKLACRGSYSIVGAAKALINMSRHIRSRP